MFELSKVSVPIIDKERYLGIIAEALATTRKIDTTKLSHQDWLAIRTLAGMGASEVAAALGFNKYQTPFDVWKNKVGDEITIEENDVMNFGNDIEDAILKMYMRKTKTVVEKDRFMYFHPVHDCLFANLDGVFLDGTPGLVECKSTVKRVFDGWAKDEEDCVQGIPLYHYSQCQHELSVTGKEWVDLAVLITDLRKLEIKRIFRDEEYIQKQNGALITFWEDFVLPMVPPDMTSGEYKYIEPMLGSFIEATPEIEQNLILLKEKKAEQKGLEKEIEKLEDIIKLHLADNENLTSAGNVLATWKSQQRRAVDSKLLKEIYPEAAKNCEKISTVRIFRIK